jgi:hypothetical protein
LGITGQDLIADLMATDLELDEARRDFVSEGIKRAEAERDYRRVLSVQYAVFRDAGHAGGASEIHAAGTDSVSNAKYLRDVAEVMHKAAGERIQHLKRKRDGLMVFYAREAT